MVVEIAQTSDSDGSNWQVRTEIEAAQSCLEQRDTALSRLFLYWHERVMLEGGLPLADEFRPPDVDLPYVELAEENPLHAIMRNHPAGISGDWSDVRFAQYPVPIHAQACALEYLHCKVRQEPTFIHIHQRIRNVERKYVKLSVPVCDKSGAVTKVIYAFRFLAFPVVYNEAA